MPSSNNSSNSSSSDGTSNINEFTLHLQEEARQSLATAVRDSKYPIFEPGKLLTSLEEFHMNAISTGIDESREIKRGNLREGRGSCKTTLEKSGQDVKCSCTYSLEIATEDKPGEWHKLDPMTIDSVSTVKSYKWETSAASTTGR